MKRSLITIAILGFGIAGCAGARSFLAISNPENVNKPIHNPFGDYYATAKNEPNQSIVLRTKKGDRSVEVELPSNDSQMSDFTIPVSPAFKDGGGRAPAGDPGSGIIDESYKDRAPSISDREITANLPQGMAEDNASRREIESGLGLMTSDEGAPERDKSYLASVDHIKQLYKYGRYEAALLETDSLLHLYQTDAKLYEMRGTLLDRLGKTELAVKSWNQALRFDPKNQPLRRFVERRQQNRSVASP
ncbi:MAG TPA: hypothetical protein VJB59_13880 [Bdellovibrionota bacterium]|nr:hypothetical protein [Bdellovibrionota bacterium]